MVDSLGEPGTDDVIDGLRYSIDGDDRFLSEATSPRFDLTDEL
jgi:hypothetical protein